MTSDRIDEILKQTAYPESASNRSALIQVWNECGHYYKSEINKLKATIEAHEIIIKYNTDTIENMVHFKTCKTCIYCDTCIMKQLSEDAMSVYDTNIKELGVSCQKYERKMQL